MLGLRGGLGLDTGPDGRHAGRAETIRRGRTLVHADRPAHGRGLEAACNRFPSLRARAPAAAATPRTSNPVAARMIMANIEISREQRAALREERMAAAKQRDEAQGQAARRGEADSGKAAS